MMTLKKLAEDGFEIYLVARKNGTIWKYDQLHESLKITKYVKLTTFQELEDENTQERQP
ncbi:MAG TPA: hypothetical protein VMD05_07970 [Candidatus Nanoarchaeia archaeon]|nr:hypothetical protein [Candidatus Nanoarchaeia archaeon]